MHDGDRDAAAGGLGGDGLDLGVVAVDQDDPVPLRAGVAALGLVEDRGDDGGEVAVIRGVATCSGPAGCGGFPAGRTMMSCGVRACPAGGRESNTRQLGHPLLRLLFPAPEPVAPFLPRGAAFGGRRAQRVRPHRHALPVEGQPQHGRPFLPVRAGDDGRPAPAGSGTPPRARRPGPAPPAAVSRSSPRSRPARGRARPGTTRTGTPSPRTAAAARNALTAAGSAPRPASAGPPPPSS